MLVSFESVSLQYEQDKPVLKEINLALMPGVFYFLTGASGAGKTSLLRLIYQMEKQTSGKIKLFGKDVSKIDNDKLALLRRRLGIVFQDFRLIPHMTALENAALPLRLAGADEETAHKYVKELMGWVGLGDRMEAYPTEMSGGEQQRVSIARAVVNKPSLILADEPTGNVDSESSKKLMHLFMELNKMGTTVIFATHHNNLVRRYAKPILRLRRGRLVSSLEEAA